MQQNTPPLHEGNQLLILGIIWMKLKENYVEQTNKKQMRTHYDFI